MFFVGDTTNSAVCSNSSEGRFLNIEFSWFMGV